MIPYNTYKPSGIDWIGDIPSHWDVKKLKYLVSGRLEYGANEVAELDDENLPRYIRITDFGDDGNLRNNTFKSLPYEVAQDYLLEEGDVLFARSGATVGKTFQFKNYKGDACFAGYLIRARPNKQLVSDFLYNYTKSGIYENWKNSIFNQATIQNIGADKYNLLFVPLPPLTEQAAIARYLDEKTAQLDTLIDRKRRLIDLLREEKTALINEAVTKGINPDVLMKDSGIEWLGAVPAHWEVKKLKYVATLRSGDSITSDSIREEGKYPVFGGNGLRGYTSNYTHDGNYVLIGRQGALCGNINYANGQFWASEHAVVATLIGKVNFIWLGELLRAMNLNQYSVSAAQPGLAVERIEALSVPVPPFKEQLELAEYIDTETTKIDHTITRIEREIELMQEYRTALISEVVTGKVKVV